MGKQVDKAERFAKGIVKSQQQEARRAEDKARVETHERATRNYVVLPHLPVRQDGHP
jgi:hypothetical protein